VAFFISICLNRVVKSYCLGHSLCIEALNKRPELIQEVYLSSNAKEESLKELISLCDKNNISYKVDDKAIHRLSIKENCYAIASFEIKKYPLQGNRHIILKDLKDEGELGTCLRSGVSFGLFDFVVINCADINSSKCVRASMGAYFHCNIESYNSLAEYKKSYPEFNIYSFCNKGKELNETELKKPFSVLFNEDGNNPFYLKHNENNELPFPMASSLIFYNISLR